MNQHYAYLAILIGSLLGPVALSFDKKVAFYKKWSVVFLAGLLPAVFFILWDIHFTDVGVWSFSTNHTLAFRLWGLPLEEILFFLVVPFCCLFIYACIRAYLPNLSFEKGGNKILAAIAAGLLIVGVFSMNRDYTCWTSVLLAIYIGLILSRPVWFAGFRSDYFLVSYAVALIPFLIVNGILTSIPIVSYNNAENLGLRIGTIPVEDVFYGMLLILMNVSILERRSTTSAA